MLLELQRKIATPEGKLVTVTESLSWIDVSPGVPVTLGSPTTKGRNVLVPEGSDPLHLLVKPYYFQVIEFGENLQPKQESDTPAQVNYQVNVTFQWDAGNWWISNKQKDQFTVNWTKAAPANAHLDWTLHL